MSTALRDRLVKDGEHLLTSPSKSVRFTGDPAADELLNDLTRYPHAFVMASLVDRQVRAELAWLVPQRIRERLGTFEVSALGALDAGAWLDLMRKPAPAHRLPETMATVLFRAVTRIVDKYHGDASRIWAERPTSGTVVRRFLEFHGAGPKIATMATNILARDFRVPLADHRAIDISADVQVIRVMGRLGFVEPGSSPEAVIHAARELNPEYPGVFDLALWDIGRNTCRPQDPDCPNCRLQALCPSALALGGGTVSGATWGDKG